MTIASPNNDNVGAGPSRYSALPTSLARGHAFFPSSDSGLDTADLKIIDMLMQDGRANNRSLTGPAGLTQETVAVRIRNMTEKNIIGVTAIFDWRAAGYTVELWLWIQCDQDIPSVSLAVAALPEVIFLYEVLGAADLIAHVLLRDTAAALDFLGRKITAIPGIRRVDVSHGLDTVKFFLQFARIPVRPCEIVLPDPVVELGDLDWSIVRALMVNGRISNREIARSLEVSDGTVRSRLRRMEDAGLIRVCAQVHPLNSGMIGARMIAAFTVRGRDARDVAADLAAMAEVLTVSLVSGRHPLIAYVVGSSGDHVIEMLVERCRPIPGIHSFQIFDVIGIAKANCHWARW